MTPTIVQYRSLNLSRLRKIRCRVLDRMSGEPVGGVVVQLALRLGDICSESWSRRRAMTATVSSDNPRGGSSVTAAGRLAALLLLSSSDDVVSDSPSLDVVFPIWTDKAEVERHACATPDLPAVQAPDAVDYELSPFSFVTPTRVSLGDGDCCEQLAPSTLPVEQHSFYKVVIHHERPAGNDNGSLNALVEPVDVAAPLEQHGETRVKLAHVLEYQQRWCSLGHTLGEIKYSLPEAVPAVHPVQAPDPRHTAGPADRQGGEQGRRPGQGAGREAADTPGQPAGVDVGLHPRESHDGFRGVLPIVRAYGLQKTTLNVVNKRDEPGFEVDWPTFYDLPLNFTN